MKHKVNKSLPSTKILLFRKQNVEICVFICCRIRIIGPSEYAPLVRDNGIVNASQPARVRILNSKVISASLGKGRHIQLSQPIRLVLKHLLTDNVTSPTCVFWNYIDQYVYTNLFYKLLANIRRNLFFYQLNHGINRIFKAYQSFISRVTFDGEFATFWHSANL